MKSSIAALALVAFGLSLSAQQPVTGTYRISVCKVGPCVAGDSSHAVAFGVLVLLDSTLVSAAIPASAGRLLTGYTTPGQPHNACYDIKRIGSNSMSYAGGVAGTHWQMDAKEGNAVTFTLYRSPDASHHVVATINGAQLSGIGRSSGAGAAEVDWPRDTVVATRIGAPDVSRCIDASIRQWKEIRKPPPN